MAEYLSEEKIRRLLGIDKPQTPDILQRPVDSLQPQGWWRPEDLDREYRSTTKLSLGAPRDKLQYGKKPKDKFFAPEEEFRFGPAQRSPIFKILGLSVLTLFLVFIFLNGPTLYERLRYWFVVDYRNQQWTTNQQNQAVASAQDTLKIPKIDLDLPIFWETPQSKSLELGKTGLIHLKDTPPFQADQPTVVYGLNSLPWWSTTDEISKLALLDKIVVGDNFTVTYQKQEYKYMVSSIDTYPSSQQEYLPAGTGFCIVSSAPTGTTINRLVVCGK